MRFRFALQLDGLFDDDPDGFETREICAGELVIDTAPEAEPELVKLFGAMNEHFASKLAAHRPNRTSTRGPTSGPTSPL